MPRHALPAATAVELSGLVEYAPDSVISRVLSRGPAGSLTLFAFDSGEMINEHATPCDAMALVLDGSAGFIIDGKNIQVSAGQMVFMPASVAHSIYATERFKMLLIMMRG